MLGGLHLGSSNLLSSSVGAVLRGGLSAGLSTSLRAILLSWAVNGDLDGDLATLDQFAVHLLDCLLLQLLGAQGDEAEATTLARLATSLKLLDHEAGDGTKSNLGRAGFVGGKEFLELFLLLAGSNEMNTCVSHLLFAEVVGQVGNHNLGGRRNAILWWATLLGWARAAFALRIGFTSLSVGFGSNVGQGKWVLRIVGSIAIFLMNISFVLQQKYPVS